MRQTLFLLLALAVLPFPASAQTYPDQSQLGDPGPPTIFVGASCDRRSDTAAGVVKVDACGRPYCGRRDELDIAEINPDFARDMHCRWTITEDETCRCKPLEDR